jgi:phage recombination protein Bet
MGDYIVSNITLSKEQTNWLESYGIDKATWLALSNSIYPGAAPESIIMVHQYCKARNLDPLKKPAHIVPMPVTDAKTGNTVWRDVVMPGISEHRITAMRTGKYAGMDQPVVGDEIEFKGVKAPEFMTVTVYRMIDGVRVPFPHTEYFVESVQTKKNGEINAMWTRRPRGQLLKCVEAGALRKAFPEELGGEITAEEMVHVEKDITPEPVAIAAPQRKSEPDGNNQEQGLITSDQESVVTSKLGILDVELQSLLDAFEVEKLSDLTSDQMPDVFAWIEGEASGN